MHLRGRCIVRDGEDKWVHLDQDGNQTSEPAAAETSRRGAIVKVIEKCGNRYGWRLHIYSHKNEPIRSGIGSDPSFLKSEEAARSEAINLVSLQEEELLRSIIGTMKDDELIRCITDPLQEELKKANEHVSAVREQAFRRGAERGIRLVCEELKKQAEDLKAKAKAITLLADEFGGRASELSWSANDPYAEKKD